MAKKYLSSSWRKESCLSSLETLSNVGHDMHDLQNSTFINLGCTLDNVDIAYINSSPKECQDYLTYYMTERLFKNYIEVMKYCDTCVLVLPYGNSTHTDAGLFDSKKKQVIVYIFKKEESELMYNEFDKVSYIKEDLFLNLSNTI